MKYFIFIMMATRLCGLENVSASSSMEIVVTDLTGKDLIQTDKAKYGTKATRPTKICNRWKWHLGDIGPGDEPKFKEKSSKMTSITKSDFLFSVKTDFGFCKYNTRNVRVTITPPSDTLGKYKLASATLSFAISESGTDRIGLKCKCTIREWSKIPFVWYYCYSNDHLRFTPGERAHVMLESIDPISSCAVE